MSDNNDLPKEDEQKKEECCHRECCGHHHGHRGPDGFRDGPHGGPHGPERGHKGEIPPHILRELMDMKEKIGKLEGMVEMLSKKL